MPGKPSAESQVNLESSVVLDFRFKVLGLESKAIAKPTPHRI
ncbi:hypothetical protein [uncultured Helicobacter sp.]